MAAKKPTKSNDIKIDKSQELLSNVQKISPTDLVRTINDVKLGIVAQFDAINSTIMEQLKTLGDVNSAIETQKNNLKDFQDIIAEGQTLQEILEGQEKALAQKDADMALKLAQQNIESYSKRITELETALAEARKSANEATQRVQTIAEKAIENAAKQAPIVFSSNNNDQPTRK